ncbi:hypothetical protein FSP39_017357 [Pinctada imbricata]|uniref:VWFA domain-containing protein n=1 Tax=Pinctada imbricata TaxID=66713 RepID=A0AA89CB27_PINIB|nr:hypothetical protein FSP39_017357 [Pinctada imbricata]
MFVLDVSGSMTGNKMNKLKAAMFEILEALQDGDRFGIISFESRSTFMNQQYLFVSANLTKSFAKHHVDSFVAGGGTNIKDALIDAIQFLNRFDSSRRSHIIFFLTDGAIYKQKNETLQAIRNANINDIPIFSLVFGNNTDDDFVRKMAAQNQGSLQRVYDNDKSDQQISGFYDEVAVTLLKDLEFVYPNGSSSVTVAKFARYLDGSELRISGKITESNISSSLFNASISGVSLDDNFDIQIEGKDISTLHNKSDMANPAQQRPSLEKMWAFMTVKEKLRELSSRVLYPSERDELRKNILDLSLKVYFHRHFISLTYVSRLTKNRRYGSMRSSFLQLETENSQISLG